VASTVYGYSVTLPTGWHLVAATRKWDGRSGLSSDAPEVDQFVGDASASSWGVAAPFKGGLGAYADSLVAATTRYHSDTCPKRPEHVRDLRIKGRTGVLLEYDCGILINLAAFIHHGVAYQFGFRDPAVNASSDPNDHADFLRILRSLRFPS
jgi:hypothetical protein